MNRTIIQAVESAINRLVEDFIRNQWLHRVEHSLHCELYCLLKASPFIPTSITAGEFTTQPIHKEWPEPKPHGKRKRRGNFDLAVIQPNLGKREIDEFRYGRLPILAAVEMGLNYDCRHLQDDWEKLKQSGVRYCYLIHLAALRCRDQRGVKNTVERVMEKEMNGGDVKIAYVDHNTKLTRKLGEPRISRFT